VLLTNSLQTISVCIKLNAGYLDGEALEEHCERPPHRDPQHSGAAPIPDLRGRPLHGSGMTPFRTDTALLERARERFFSDGDVAAAESVVRPPILASWRRSALHGLNPSKARPILIDPTAHDSQLMRAARPKPARNS
jgi:hypothetical protein